jgi:3-hydroxybutyryl-CoA dehydratase
VTHSPPQIKVGDVAELVRMFKENDVQIFADVVEDHSPVYLNPNYAKNTIYGRRIVHIGLVLSLVPKVVFAMSDKLPLMKSQQYNFNRPVHIGDTVRVKAEVMDMYPAVLNKGGLPVFASTVVIKVNCINQKDQSIFDGKVEIIV